MWVAILIKVNKCIYILNVIKNVKFYSIIKFSFLNKFFGKNVISLLVIFRNKDNHLLIGPMMTDKQLIT